MRKIINRKVYDTSKAKELAYFESDYPITDYSWYEETLFQKKSGEFFLLGCGNAMSPYTKRVDSNSWSGAVKIIPLTIEQAKDWTEEKANSCYEEIFGEVQE